MIQGMARPQGYAEDISIRRTGTGTKFWLGDDSEGGGPDGEERFYCSWYLWSIVDH